MQRSRAGSHTLALTPDGHVIPIRGLADDELVGGDILDKYFILGDARGILGLAAELIDQRWSGALGFWRDFGKAFLTAALREDTLHPSLPSELVESTLLLAPPMQGGEYLGAAILERLWADFPEAASAMLEGTGGDLAS